jgi:hypothetical protein
MRYRFFIALLTLEDNGDIIMLLVDFIFL